MAAPRRLRLFHYNTWADALQEAAAWLAGDPARVVPARLADPQDERLAQMARLDCDWHAENTRCFAALAAEGLDFAPAFVVGTRGLPDLLKRAARRPPDEEWWLVLHAQMPQALAGFAEQLFAYLRRNGVRVLYYAFDEASRAMPCFNALAPHLDILIHDEAPLADAGRRRLRPDCRTLHRSWVANLLPWQAPFHPAPEKRILFLGSQLGLTAHRRRQIDFLQRRFKDRFVASHDHTVSVADRLSLNRYKVGFCPEGRKFTTPAMSGAHTDRPFWSGCLGMVPVSENSARGDRLESLAQAGLILRYAHDDLPALAECCEQALECPDAERRRIYDHFNQSETIGAVVAAQLAAYYGPAAAGAAPLAEVNLAPAGASG